MRSLVITVYAYTRGKKKALGCQCLRGHLVPRAPAHIVHGKDISPPTIGHSPCSVCESHPASVPHSIFLVPALRSAILPSSAAPSPPPSSLPRKIKPSIMPSEKRSQPHDAGGRETQQRSRKRERYTRIAWLVPLCTHTDSPRHAPMQGKQDILTTYRPQANAHPEASPARRGRSSAAAACPVADVWSSTPIANTTTMFRSPTPRTTRLCPINPFSHHGSVPCIIPTAMST